jgi:hypothetical protein
VETVRRIRELRERLRVDMPLLGEDEIERALG